MAWSKEEMYKITAEEELREGMYVNLGIGMPTEIPNYIPKDVKVILQSENGMLGIGPFPTKDKVDADLINAGKQTISELSFSSYFDSSNSFAMIRGAHIDLTILGALQVSETGDLANWTIPGKMVKGMGGAMDLVSNVKRVVIIMEHNTKDGGAKIVKKCILPLTGVKVVDRIITELGIFDFLNTGLTLVKKPQSISIDEIKAKTEANFHVAL